MVVKTIVLKTIYTMLVKNLFSTFAKWNTRVTRVRVLFHKADACQGKIVFLLLLHVK
jgi:hypothetical protein